MPTAINTNAPQAKDDLYNTSSGFLVLNENVGEGTTGYAISIAALMANDLGGSAKTFYGLGAGSSKMLLSDKEASLNVVGDKIMYDPNGRFEALQVGQSVEDSFQYTIKMANGTTSVATVKVLVKGLNDAPNANVDTYEFTEDQALVVTDSVLKNDDDIDNTNLTAVKVSGPSNGTLALNSDGTFTYTPNANFAGVDSFTYKAFDGRDYSDVVKVTLNGTDVPEPKATFGAVASGMAIKVDYGAGDYDHHRTTVFTEGYTHLSYTYRADAPNDEFYAVQTDYLNAVSSYFGQNADSPPTRGTYPDYDPVTGARTVVEIEYERHHHHDQHGEWQALLEFDVSEAAGLVSGATLKFNADQATSYTEAGASATTEVEFFVYAGDRAITTADYDAGILAGAATFNNASGLNAAVTLDAAAVNTILASGADTIGVGVRAVSSDPGYDSTTTYSYDVTALNGIRAQSVSLDFAFA